MVAQVLKAIAIGCRKNVMFSYKNTRGKRVHAIGKIVAMWATVRGLSFKLDSGKTVTIKMTRAEIAQVYA